MNFLAKGYAGLFNVLFGKAGMNSHHTIGIKTKNWRFSFNRGAKKVKSVLKVALGVTCVLSRYSGKFQHFKLR